jgi:peptide/nickel transport system substrate-binding protein
VTFRIISEPGARVAGLRNGELHGVEDLPATSVPDLKNDTDITILPLKNWWIQMASPNISNPPTDNLLVRKAIQAALDMDEIMGAASDGNYQLNVGFQYPDQPDYTDAGKETYNQRNPDLAKQYLADAGYQGEPVVLLTNKDYPPMYNSALIIQQQLQAVGINAEMKVVDWPTSVQMALNTTEGWNIYFTAWGTQPALGALATMQFLIQPNASYKPVDGKDDPDVLTAWKDMNALPTVKGRQEAFTRMQQLVLERVYAFPLGSLTKIQAVRSNVNGFEPFRIPRMANVWFSP